MAGRPSRFLYTECEDGPPGFEGRVKLVPQKVACPPSERAARHRKVAESLRMAHAVAAERAAGPLCQGRCSLAGLILLWIIRGISLYQGTIPGYSVFGMHFLTTTSDMACVLCASPLFIFGTSSRCVQVGCVGPMLTLVFAMCVVDIGALSAYLVVATPRPLSPGAKSYIDVAEACIGVWDFALVSSVALQLALCASSWRVYRELRMTGIYPPGTNPASNIDEISFMEIICEAEDVKVLNECECIASCTGGGAEVVSVEDGAGVASP